MRNLTIRILLCCCLVAGVKADPIGYRQLVQSSNPPANLQTPASGEAGSGQQQQPGASEDGAAHPEFVRLPDGRIVPYGPGVICDVQGIDSSEVIDSPSSRRWLIAVPFIAGAALCAFLCRFGGHPTAVSESTRPPDVTPVNPPASVPEPATLILLGIGLSILAQRGLGRKPSA